MAADHSKLEGRYWPTAAQFIVVWGGEPDTVAQWMAALLEHQEAARDVIDLWDDWMAWPGPDDYSLLGEAIERLRFTTTQVRQWQVQS